MSYTSTMMAGAVELLSEGVHELGSAMGHITEYATRASQVADAGARMAGETSGQVHELSAAAQTIDEVVAVIATVAGQTRLLALNATIEAAGAGEHGHGFAVVAEEVKQLADQTSQATEKIRQRIEAARQAAGAAAGAIERITETIVEVDRAQQSIADSVQAQSANAHAMTGSVDAVTAGAQAMADAASTLVDAAGEATSAVEATAEVATEVTGSVDRLRELVAQLRA